MKKILIISLLCSLLFLSNFKINAMQSIGANYTTTVKNIDDVPIENWSGKEFIVLELSQKPLLNYLFIDKECSTPVDYPSLYGKTLKVVGINKLNDNFYDYLVRFALDQYKTFIYGRSFRGQIDNIAPIDDLKKAKARWMGKIVFLKVWTIETFDNITEKIEQVSLKKGEPLTVVDIIPSFIVSNLAIQAGQDEYFNEESYPFWVIVKRSNGHQGFIPILYSLTNTCKYNWYKPGYADPRSLPFFETDPRKSYPWGDAVWNLIANHKINIGWDIEKLKMSWGDPEKINYLAIADRTTKEQWVYDHNFVYLEKGFVTAIQSY